MQFLEGKRFDQVFPSRGSVSGHGGLHDAGGTGPGPFGRPRGQVSPRLRGAAGGQRQEQRRSQALGAGEAQAGDANATLAAGAKKETWDSFKNHLKSCKTRSDLRSYLRNSWYVTYICQYDFNIFII